MKRVFVSFILAVLWFLFPGVVLAESSWTFYYIQTVAPTSCSVGELWFKSNAAAGSNWYGCTAANTWTLQGPSGLTVGTTTITGGATTRCLFDDAGNLGEDAGCTYNKATGVLTLTGGFLGPNGNVASPAFAFTSAPGWGMYKGTGVYNNISFALGNSGRGYFGITGNGAYLPADGSLTWSSANDLTSAIDTFISRHAAAVVKQGLDSATPIAQTFKGPDGSGTNIVGGNLTVAAGNSTGNAAGGSLILSTTPAGASGSALNSPVAAITIASTGLVTFNVGFNVSTLPTCNAGAKGSRAHVNDANAACTFVAAPVGGGSVVCPVFCNGTAWVEG